MEKAFLLAAILLVWWVFFRVLLAPLTPIVLGFLVALAVTPLTARLERVMPRGLAAVVSVGLAFLVLLGGVAYLGHRLLAEVTALARNFDGPAFARLIQDLIPPQLAPWAGEIRTRVAEETVNVISGSAHKLLEFLAHLPETAISAFVALLVAYYFAKNLPDYWEGFLRGFTPVWQMRLKAAVVRARRSFVGYLLAQGALGVITFVITVAVLAWFGAPYALTLSGLAAVSEMIPKIGATVFFVPWIAYLFLSGEATLGYAVLAIFTVVGLLRRYIEPEIWGHHAEISPLAIIVSMLVGLEAAGFLGVFLGPLIWSVSLALIDDAHLTEES